MAVPGGLRMSAGTGFSRPPAGYSAPDPMMHTMPIRGGSTPMVQTVPGRAKTPHLMMRNVQPINPYQRVELQ